MSLREADRELIEAELGRAPTRAEAALFENLWSEHCAYRSSRPLLGAFESDGEQVVVGPGDDAAVVAVPEAEDTYLTMGIESHNHPSYVDPYDGAATGVGGIVRDTLSMGAYPVALSDSLYFGAFDREHSRYLFEGVVEGIADYGNAIGVPTVTGSVDFHPDYEGNPLVNVGCVGLVSPDRLVTAAAKRPGNRLVLVGNSTGRDGLGGASFASEDLSEDAATEDRPAVQVGDPYTEKLLIEANETLIDRGLVVAARDLGAAGLGGATAEMVAQGGLGAQIDLDSVHQREPGMNALEILLAESQERMCYEVHPDDVDEVTAVAERFDLGVSPIGEVTKDRYVCTFAGGGDRETVVDVPAEFLADGAPTNDLEIVEPPEQPVDRPDADLGDAFETVLASPNTASKEWVYRQYDHEVGLRTALRPGDDAAVLTLFDDDAPGPGATDDSPAFAISAGAAPNWTDAAPRAGARAVALENATNLAVKGARPLAAVDCLNGGNPETPAVYGGFAAAVDGLAEMCATLDVPVVGGNVSLYNDSESGPVPPTPTVMMVGTREGYAAPPARAVAEAEVVLLGDLTPELGGSEYCARLGGTDRFPELPTAPRKRIADLVRAADLDSTLGTHDVSHGGLAVTLAELVDEAGLAVQLPGEDPAGELFGEAPGRAVVVTHDSEELAAAVSDATPVTRLGSCTDSPVLNLTVGDETISYEASAIRGRRSTLDREMD